MSSWRCGYLKYFHGALLNVVQTTNLLICISGNGTLSPRRKMSITSRSLRWRLYCCYGHAVIVLPTDKQDRQHNKRRRAAVSLLPTHTSTSLIQQVAGPAFAAECHHESMQCASQVNRNSTSWHAQMQVGRGNIYKLTHVSTPVNGPK
jgi:hypothetical protein